MMDENVNPKEQGQSLVELAMSLVILLTLLAGLVDFGRAFFTFVALRDAAQEGAAYASIINADPLEDSNDVTAYCQGITNRVLITTSDLNGGPAASGPVNLQELANAGEITIQTLINGNDCSTVSPADVCMGSAVSVTVTYDSFPLTTPLLGSILGTQTLTIDADINETILTPACQ